MNYFYLITHNNDNVVIYNLKFINTIRYLLSFNPYIVYYISFGYVEIVY